MLRPRSAGTSRGFSMVELMVAVAILALLTTMAVPPFVSTLRDARIRTTAESVAAALYYARGEAARRNAVVRFQTTSTLDNACALATAGQNWVVSLAYSGTGTAASPAGACASTLDDTASPFLLRRSEPLGTGSTMLTTANRAVTAFDGLGRLSTLRGTIAATALTVDVTSTDSTCLAVGGAARCLRVVVMPGGQISVCDPAHTTSTDPLTCPA